MVRQAISARFLAAERRLIPVAGHKTWVPFVSPRSVPANSRAGRTPATSLDTCPGCERAVHPAAPGRCAQWHPDGGIRRGCHPSLDGIADIILSLDAECRGFHVGGRRRGWSLAAYFRAAGIWTDDDERKLHTRVLASLGDERLLGKSWGGPSPHGPECGACRLATALSAITADGRSEARSMTTTAAACSRPGRSCGGCAAERPSTCRTTALTATREVLMGGSGSVIAPLVSHVTKRQFPHDPRIVCCQSSARVSEWRLGNQGRRPGRLLRGPRRPRSPHRHRGPSTRQA